MLNSTHDPVGDFINALLADLMNYGSQQTLESFVHGAFQLSELSSFPVLISRAEAIGFKIGKVVYRGYSTTGALQMLSDQAIKARTEMKIRQEEQDQKDRIKDREIKAQQLRGDAEREEERMKIMHTLEMEAASHKESIRKQKETMNAEMEALSSRNEANVAFLSALKDLNVDLTTYLVAKEGKVKDSNPAKPENGNKKS